MGFRIETVSYAVFVIASRVVRKKRQNSAMSIYACARSCTSLQNFDTLLLARLNFQHI
jgi:hypothetical protein